jgi:hypothetical protein
MPTSVFSGITGNRTMQEMLSLANEMAQRIAYDERDWTLQRKTVTFTGDGVTTGFAMPVDYKRMLLTSNVWRSTQTLYPMRFIPDTDEWLNRRSRNYYDSCGEWTMLGGQMLIAPTLGGGITAYFAYLNKNCITLASGGAGDSFQADGDTFPLGERVLKLGMIWQWKANKGSPATQKIWALHRRAGAGDEPRQPGPDHHRPPPDIGECRTAYPFPVPT